MPVTAMNFFSFKIVRLYIKFTKDKDHNKKENKKENKNKRENKKKKEREGRKR
jgi:flagellar biosynthesis component FlhA